MIPIVMGLSLIRKSEVFCGPSRYPLLAFEVSILVSAECFQTFYPLERVL
jgi:hypothetical protein